MSRYSTKLLGFGDNVVDIYDHLKTMYPGGNCVNVSVYGKMAGCEKTAYMGYFGDDDRAELIMDTLEKIGVETVKCRQLHGENGYSRITLKDGDREFLDFNDGGIRGKTPYILDRFDLEYMKGFDVVHSGNYSFTESELHKIKEVGIPVSFDFSDDSTEEYYEKTAPYVTYAFCSFDGTDEEAEEHLKKLTSMGPELAMASRGAKGCILYDGEKFFAQEAAPLEKVKDTLGAGDSLIASFLTGFIGRTKAGMDKETAIRESLEEAAAFAAGICGMEGAFGYGKKYE